jgi:hypothetical protein
VSTRKIVDILKKSVYTFFKEARMSDVIFSANDKLSGTLLERPMTGKTCMYYMVGKCLAKKTRCPFKDERTGQCLCK